MLLYKNFEFNHFFENYLLLNNTPGNYSVDKTLTIIAFIAYKE